MDVKYYRTGKHNQYFMPMLMAFDADRESSISHFPLLYVKIRTKIISAFLDNLVREHITGMYEVNYGFHHQYTTPPQKPSNFNSSDFFSKADSI